LTVILEISGDPAAALDVVNNVLDDGVFQDAINEYETGGGPIHVESALVDYGPDGDEAGDTICDYCGKTVEHGRCRECGREAG